jgi:predicted nucleotidyltransferase
MKTIALREKDLEVLRQTFRRFPAVREVRVFGSRATGESRRASDIDLAISAPDATPGEWAEISEALENAPLIYELDIVRPEKTENERLKEKIAREGITVFPERK